MELYQLKSFLAVVYSGSLSQAAASRHISLPGISKHIKMLEEELGLPLFTRTPKGMVLTEGGQRVLVHAERIQKEVDVLTGFTHLATSVRVGVNISPDFLRFLELQQMLMQHHPDGSVTLTNNNSGVLLSSLVRGELDLCLAFGEVPDHLLTLPVKRVEMVLMVPTSIPCGDIDLNSQCWVVNIDGCPFKAPLETFWRNQGILPRQTILAQDLSRRELVAQGLGIGFLEPQDGLMLIERGLGWRLGSYSLEIPLWVVYREPVFAADAQRLQRYIQSRYDSLAALETAADRLQVAT